MGSIRQLDQHLTNMIAAGEVIERPAGVVKELVENAIDAQADMVEVRIKDGGISYIEVSDNGVGMDSDDAVMAFARHATSKIHNDSDLWSIRTMGFRGEALPSIAAVSRVALFTNNKQESTNVELAYGQTKNVRSIFCPEGTRITVSDLFQKTPARLKHLKTRQYEGAIIAGMIEKFALSHPEIAFAYYSEDKTIFSTKGNGDIVEIMASIYGNDAAKNTVIVTADDYDYHLTCAYVLPSINRATQRYVSVFVNARMIRSYRMQKVITQAFKDYIAEDRYPIVICNIAMDPQLVDVNVHPSKWEVRLSKEQQLEELIRKTLIDSLKNSMKAPELKVNAEPAEKVEFTNFDFNEVAVKHDIADLLLVREDKPAVRPVPPEAIQVINRDNHKFPIMTVIGQFHGNYILAEAEEGLYVIDQHAAQERFNYERFQKLMTAKDPEYQTLLIPLVIEAGNNIQEEFEDVGEMLKKLNITIERFGNDSVLCRYIPTWMNDIDVPAFIRDMIDFYHDQRDTSLLAVRKAAIASLACHTSVKFNHHLTLDEMKQVLINLQKCDNPFNCPHGRPTFILLTDKQLKKEFLR